MVLFRRVLGDVLRRERMLQGLTLREVSATARVSLGYISEIERGQKEASSELLSSLCGALDTPLSDVLREVSDAVAVEEARQAIGTTPLARRPAQRRRRRRLRRLIRPLQLNGGKTAGAQAQPLPKHLPIRYQVLWTSRARRRVRVAAASSAALTLWSERFSLCSCALHGHRVLDLAPRS